MAAESIGVFRDVVCHHRVNRPGQTMASTGRELLAFFDHFVRMADLASPRHIGNVQQTVDTFFEFHKRTVIGNVANFVFEVL